MQDILAQLSQFFAGSTPETTYNAGPRAPRDSLIPQARPDPFVVNGPKESGQRGSMGGFFPEQGSKERHDLVQQLVMAGMQSAQQGSPLANLLAPLVGTAVLGRSMKKRGDKSKAEQGAMADQLLGAAQKDPRVKGYMDVLNNPDAPDYMKSIAKSKLEAIVNPPTAKTSVVSPQRPPTNTDMLIARLIDAAIKPESDGGPEVTPAEKAQIELVKQSRMRTSQAEAAKGSVTDELTGVMTGTGGSPTAPVMPEQPVNPNDPLGILN